MGKTISLASEGRKADIGRGSTKETFEKLEME